jgi:Mce-associated membrane protein
MSTTRHHINRQRRRQARETRPTLVASGPGRGGPDDEAAPAGRARTGLAVLPVRAPSPGTSHRSPAPGAAEPDGTQAPGRSRIRRPSRAVGLSLLCLLTLVLGGFSGWAHGRAEALRDDPAVRNTALTDAARTSEIKGQAEKAVAALFSYDHADPAAFEKATKDLLTGKAVAQHTELLADVRARADQQKAVITTTVTDSAVERIDGDRARVLVYADQSSVSTAGSKSAKDSKDQQAADAGTYAGAMLAVDVVLRDGHWLVSGIDTFGR